MPWAQSEPLAAPSRRGGNARGRMSGSESLHGLMVVKGGTEELLRDKDFRGEPLNLT